MARMAVIRNGVVENVVEMGSAQWSPPVGTTLVAAGSEAGPGWSWDGRAFVPPPMPEPPVPFKSAIERRIEALEAKAAGARS